MGEGVDGDTHINKLRSFQSNYLEDALLVILIIFIVVGTYFGCRILVGSDLAVLRFLVIRDRLRLCTLSRLVISSACARLAARWTLSASF